MLILPDSDLAQSDTAGDNWALILSAGELTLRAADGTAAANGATANGTTANGGTAAAAEARFVLHSGEVETLGPGDLLAVGRPGEEALVATLFSSATGGAAATATAAPTLRTLGGSWGKHLDGADNGGVAPGSKG